MPNETPEEPNRLYVDSSAPELPSIRDWLFTAGLDSRLHVDETRCYFDVTMPAPWSDKRRKEIAGDLAAIRAKLGQKRKGQRY